MKTWKRFLQDILDDDDFCNEDYCAARNDLLLLLPPTQDDRSPRFRHQRHNNLWAEHVLMCRHTGEFTDQYHMTEPSFNKLVDFLSPHLHVDEVKSRNSSGGIEPIDKRVIAAAGLRW
jgi:hypothetical protein